MRDHSQAERHAMSPLRRLHGRAAQPELLHALLYPAGGEAPAELCRMKELDRFLVDLHVLAVGDRGGLGRAYQMAPAPGQARGVELLKRRLMVLKGMHLGEVVVDHNPGETADQCV